MCLDSGKLVGPANARDVAIGRLQRSCIYLEDSTAIVNGIKIFGSPWWVKYQRELHVTLSRLYGIVL